MRITIKVPDNIIQIVYLPPYSPELNPVERVFEDIKKHLKNKLFYLIEELEDAVEWVAKEFKVKYSYWGMRSLFVRLGIKKKVPRPKAEKACAEAQKGWKKGGLLQLLGSMG